MLWLTAAIHCNRCPAQLSLASFRWTAGAPPRRRMTALARRHGWRQTYAEGDLVELCPRCVATTGFGLPHRTYPSKVDRQAALQDYLAGATLAQIGQKFGVTRERIRQILARLLAKAPERKRKCRDCSNTVATPQRICQTCRAKVRIRRLNRCACGRPCYRSHCQACSRRGTRKFNHELAGELYRNGHDGVSIAAYFGVNPAAVYRALRVRKIPRRSRKLRREQPVEQIEDAVARIVAQRTQPRIA